MIAGVTGPQGDLGPCVVLVDGVEIGKTLANVKYTYVVTEAPVMEDQAGDDSVDDIIIGQPTNLFIPFTRFQLSLLSSVIPGATGSGTSGETMTIRDVTGQSGYSNAVNVRFVRIVDGDSSSDADDVVHFFKVRMKPNFDVPFDVATQRVYMQECRVYKVHQGEVHAGDIFRVGAQI